MEPDRASEPVPNRFRPMPATPSASLAFGAALVAVILSAVALVQVISMRQEQSDLARDVGRMEATLSAMGYRVNPGTDPGGMGPDPIDALRNLSPRAALDKAKVAAALADLQQVRNGLTMMIAESGMPFYPPENQIRNYEDLRRLLADYVPLKPTQADANWVFLSYARPSPEEFVLLAEARDALRTFITATPNGITQSTSK